eukprot:tig00000980_g6130.t1
MALLCLTQRDAREVEEQCWKLWQEHQIGSTKFASYSEFDQARDFLIADVLRDSTSLFDVRIAFEVLYRPLSQAVARLEAAQAAQVQDLIATVELLKESREKAGGEAGALEKSLRAIEKINCEKELLLAQLREAHLKNEALVRQLEEEFGCVVSRGQPSSPSSNSSSSEHDESLMNSLLTPASSFRKRVSALASKAARKAKTAEEDRQGLVARVADLNAHCENLGDALSVLRNENDELRAAVERASNRVMLAEEDMKLKMVEISTLKETLEGLRRDMGVAHTEVAETRERHEAILNRLRQSESELATLRSENESLRGMREKVVELEERMIIKIQECREAQRECNNLRCGLGEVQKLADQMRNGEREARERLREAELTCSRLMGDIAERRRAEMNSRMRIVFYKEEEIRNLKLRAQKASVIAQSRTLQREGDQLALRIKELEMQIASPASAGTSPLSERSLLNAMR